MRIIRGQIIATTSTDLHGDNLSKDELQQLFEQMTDPMIMNQEHDFTKPPICKSYNKQLYQLESGEWAIKCDVDIFDEEAFDRYGGFSISFTTCRYTIDPNNEPSIEIRFNPRIFNRDEILKIMDFSGIPIQIDILELKQKGLEIPAIIFLSFATGAIASGFFNKLGGDIYDVLKRQIIKVLDLCKKEKNTEPTLNVSLNIDYQGHPLKVIILVKMADITVLENNRDLVNSIKNYITKVIGECPLRVIALEVCTGEQQWLHKYYIDTDGNTFS